MLSPSLSVNVLYIRNPTYCGLTLTNLTFPPVTVSEEISLSRFIIIRTTMFLLKVLFQRKNSTLKKHKQHFQRINSTLKMEKQHFQLFVIIS